MLSSHHWCILSHLKTRNSDTGHKHSQHSFLLSLLILCWFELREKTRQGKLLACGGTQIQVTCQATLFGEHIPAIALSNQPTLGAWLTCDLERTEDSYKLCLRAGKAQGMWLKRRWGDKKAVPNASASSNSTSAVAMFGKPSGCGYRSSVPGRGTPRLQDTASPFSASPAKAARSQPAASRLTGAASDSPKGAMNAFLRPRPAHWHTSAHICPADSSPACPGDTTTGKGHRSLTFRIRCCLDRSANPCAFASLCHACRWSGGQHPLRYGRDIRHSWCLTLSPSGTFSP